MHWPFWQLQVAVIGEHHRLAQQAAQERQRGSVELRQVQVQHIRLARQLPGPRQHARHHHPLADP